MNNLIKEKLKELLGVCLDKNIHFEYCDHVNWITVWKTNSDYSAIDVVRHYSLDVRYVSIDEHITNIDLFIEQVKNF